MNVCFLHSNEPELVPLLDRLNVPCAIKAPSPGEYEVVIQWGPYHQEQAGQRRLQPVRGVLRAVDRRKASSHLAVHGIRYEPDARPDDYPYLFRVLIFHLETIALFHRKAEGPLIAGNYSKPRRAFSFEELPPDTAGFHVNRAKREAIKALYGLGLDYGAVTVGIRDADTAPEVIDLNAMPELDVKLAEYMAEAINRYSEQLMSEKRNTRQITIGADPEFVLRNAYGEIEFADRYMGKDGRFGCDSIVLPGRRKIFPLAELRPAPSTDIGGLIVNLHRTMQMASSKIGEPHIEWLAGGMPIDGYPIGGHIHFGSVWLNVHLLRALDNYLALPLMLAEAETTVRRRPKYGFLGDYRRKPHGFEYRTLPSWLVSPAVAKGVLALALVIAHHYTELTNDPLQLSDHQRCYYEGRKKPLLATVKQLWSDMESTATYARYKTYIEPLKKRILEMSWWDEQTDIRAKWKLPAVSGPPAAAPAKESAVRQIML
jgi:hypothetical protein